MVFRAVEHVGGILEFGVAETPVDGGKRFRYLRRLWDLTGLINQARGLAWRPEWFVDVNGHFVDRFDSYVFPGSQVAIVVDEVCCSPNLEASGSPRPDGGEVIYDEGDLRVFQYVPILVCSSKDMAAYVEVCTVEVEPHRSNIRVSILRGGSDTSQMLRLDVVDLLLSESQTHASFNECFGVPLFIDRPRLTGPHSPSLRQSF